MGIILEANHEELQRIFRDAFVKKLRSEFLAPTKINAIKQVVAEAIKARIRTSKTWTSLLNGTDKNNLRAHFGIPKGTESSRLNEILDTWSNEIVVRPNPVQLKSNDQFIVSYVFYAIQADWANVLSLKAGISPNNSKNKDAPREIPWLSWLLVAGDKLEIQGYFISPIKTGGYPRSRSGDAVMVKPKAGVSASWVVPRQFAPFDTNDNFVTEQLSKLAEDKSFRSNLGKVFTGGTSLEDAEITALINEI